MKSRSDTRHCFGEMHCSYFDKRGDELLQERVLQKGRPVVVEEVDEQTLNVRAVLILIKKEQGRGGGGG